MTMAMMQVGIVRMLVPHRLVLMPVRVRLRHRTVVAVLMVFVVHVAMFMRYRFVGSISKIV
jgi:hypothetical protein